MTSHARPDGDAIGSVLACSMILEQLGKHADIVLADRVPLIYRTLPCVDCIQQRSGVDRSYDAVILLECDGVERSRLSGLQGQFLINMDHHASGRHFADFNWIDTKACAVAEMIYQVALAAGVRVTPEMATCLYTAVLTDTGSFGYINTNANTLALALDLVQHGANAGRIAQDVYFSNPASKIRLLGAALSKLHTEERLAWTWISQQDMYCASAAEEDCEGVVNYLIGIQGVEAAVFLRELPDSRFRLSLRSKGAVDVAKVAECFGGGGHENASGCTLEGPLTLASERILDQLRMELRHTVHPLPQQHGVV
ncbi:MAG: DHH family phosphoesterase [Acidobacteriaceae bacterium]